MAARRLHRVHLEAAWGDQRPLLNRVERSGRPPGGRDEAVVVVQGALDFETRYHLIAAVRQALFRMPRRLIIDLGRVTFLDASGCGALATAAHQSRSFGVPIALRGDLAPSVRGMLEIAMLASVFDSPSTPRLRPLD